MKKEEFAIGVGLLVASTLTAGIVQIALALTGVIGTALGFLAEEE
jgi:hypothetical protein